MVETHQARTVLERWPRADAFYAERDHRTLLGVSELHRYASIPVEIVVDAETAGDPTTQRIAVLAANLTARWARNVAVAVEDVPLAEELQLEGNESLRTRIAREMLEADPFGAFDVGAQSNAKSGRLRLCVGPWRGSDQAEADYVVDASGWSARGTRGAARLENRRTAAFPPAAALAASLGAADLFKRAVGHQRGDWLGSVSWCTWCHRLHADGAAAHDDPAIPRVGDVGEVLVAGVGAVGSALAYTLCLMPLTGRVTVLDRDKVEASNLNRSPLFSAAHAAAGSEKVDATAALLSRRGVAGRIVRGTWRQHVERLSREPFDVWVSLTNEDAAWADVPFQLPPVVLHGTTTSGWGAALGRHIPRVEDCTACRLPRPRAAFRGPCAIGEIESADASPAFSASLPFLSTVAGALVAAELLKLGRDGASSLPNAVSADFRAGLPAVISLSVGPTPGCGGCRVARLPLWSERGGRSRYRDLSFPIADGT